MELGTAKGQPTRTKCGMQPSTKERGPILYKRIRPKKEKVTKKKVQHDRRKRDQRFNKILGWLALTVEAVWVAGKPPPALIRAGIVVVFDFDRTLIDGDSDSWVVTEMGLTQLFNKLRSTMPWNSLMERMMRELHLQGKTSEDIKECLKRTPMHPRVIAAIKSAHASGCDLRIISDANQFFIETILEYHGLLGCFSQIITNPSFVDGDGRLRIFPYHDSVSPSHGCDICPPNMCKGLVIDKIRAYVSENGRKRFIYLGDGRNDFCPTLKLVEGDHVMPRKNYALWVRICSNPTLIKADIHEWSDGEELEKILLHLIHIISTEEISCSDSRQLNSSQHKCQTTPDD